VMTQLHSTVTFCQSSISGVYWLIGGASRSKNRRHIKALLIHLNHARPRQKKTVNK
jgi:hypothetical protein